MPHGMDMDMVGMDMRMEDGAIGGRFERQNGDRVVTPARNATERKTFNLFLTP